LDAAQPDAANAGLPDEADDEVGGPIALAIVLADAAQDVVADAPMQAVPTHNPD
jgi:hypothetical protein